MNLSDFPPDVVIGARTARDRYFAPGCSVDLGQVIAEAIVADRAIRPTLCIGGLTAHQKRVFDYLAAFIAEIGIAPSYEQIRDHLGLASKSGVQRVIVELEERGRIKRLPNRSRAITIIANPAN